MHRVVGKCGFWQKEYLVSRYSISGAVWNPWGWRELSRLEKEQKQLGWHVVIRGSPMASAGLAGSSGEALRIYLQRDSKSLKGLKWESARTWFICLKDLENQSEDSEDANRDQPRSHWRSSCEMVTVAWLRGKEVVKMVQFRRWKRGRLLVYAPG